MTSESPFLLCMPIECIYCTIFLETKENYLVGAMIKRGHGGQGRQDDACVEFGLERARARASKTTHGLSLVRRGQG